MKTYLKALGVLFFLFFNYFGFKYIAMGLNAPNDLTFIVGAMGGVILLVTDIYIVIYAVKKFTGGSPTNETPANE